MENSEKTSSLTDSDDCGDLVRELADDDDQENVCSICDGNYCDKMGQTLTGNGAFDIIDVFTKPVHRIQTFTTIV